MKLATWNLIGISDKFKQKALVEDLTQYDLDIVAIQETHIKGTSKVELDRNYTLYHWGSGWPSG